MPSSEAPRRAEEPGSFVMGTDGILRPNLDDEAMRKRLTTEAPAEAEKSAGGEETTDVS